MSNKLLFEYLSEVEFFNEKPINFDDNLEKALSKFRDLGNELHHLINEDISGDILKDSVIELKAEIKNQRIFSKVSYTIERDLSEIELESIVDLTTKQLSDGYGEEPVEINLSNNILFKKIIHIGLLGNDQSYPVKIEKIIDNKPVTIYKKIECSTDILKAVETGNLELVSLYLNSQDSINCQTLNGSSLLTYAISKKQEKVAKLLINNGVNISNLNKQLMYACYVKSIDLAAIFLDKGADVNNNEINGRSPLLWAGNDLDMVKFLVSKGADINAQNDYGRSALSLKTNPDVIEWLLINGANASHQSEEGKTSLDYIREDMNYTDDFALLKSYKDIIKLFNKYK